MKYRVIVNGVSFYTTGAQIKRGVGDSISLNTVVRTLFGNMFNAVGVTSRMVYHDGAMKATHYDVAISKV